MLTRISRTGSKLLFWFIVFLVLLTATAGIVLGMMTGVAEAQENGTVTEPIEDRNPTEECKMLDGNVYLCDKSLEDDGTAELVFYAEEDTPIKLGDAGVFLADGEMTIEEYELNGDRMETIEFGVTVSGGDSAVSISTPDGQFGESLSTGWWTPSLPGNPSSADWAVSMLSALSTGTLIVIGCTYWFKNRNGGSYSVF